MFWLRNIFLIILCYAQEVFSMPCGICDRAKHVVKVGTQWLSGRVLDSRLKGCRFEPHRGHWVVVLEQDTFILD